MPNKFNLDYDAEEDLLYLYSPGKKSKGSIELGELVVDLEKGGNVVGLEIFNASRYLSDLTNRKITKENLKKIERAEFSFSTRKGTC